MQRLVNTLQDEYFNSNYYTLTNPTTIIIKRSVIFNLTTRSTSYTFIVPNYYKELLEKFGIDVDNIYTDDWSDGKYKLVVNNEEFKITAWDDLEGVIDNVDSMIELFKSKELKGELEI